MQWKIIDICLDTSETIYKDAHAGQINLVLSWDIFRTVSQRRKIIAIISTLVSWCSIKVLELRATKESQK